MRSLLITGANRGIGLDLVKQFLNHETSKPEILIATARNPSDAKELQELASKHKSLHILPLDVTNFGSFNEFHDKVSKIVGKAGLNVLFNNAGIFLHLKEDKLNGVTPEILTDQFITNTVAPVILSKTLLPLLKDAASKKGGVGISVNRAAMIFMSSILGSINNNEGEYGGQSWGYRESKAALDMAVRSIHNEVLHYGIGVLALHPGWVQTDLGGPNAPITPAQSAQGLIKVILSLNDKNNGSFIQYNGQKLPW